MRSGFRRAYSIIYTVIAFTALSGVVSLGVDYGRVQLANSELQAATDAAARYAVKGLIDSTYLAKAQATASQNNVDGTPLALLAADVEIGNWNSTTQVFTLNGTPSNAVRVIGRRTSERGTAVQTLFARAVGMTSCDLSAESIATQGGASAYHIVGLSSVAHTGSGLIRRDPAQSGTVEVGGNGTWSLTWGQQIAGNVYYRGGPPSTPNGSNCITGALTQLASDLAYPAPTAPGGATALGAVNMTGGGTYTVGAGNYTATSMTMSGAATTVNITGDVNLYCSGTVNISNVTINTGGTTNKLTIYQTGSGAVTFNVGTVYARIYAPNSTVNINGSTSFIGSIVANNLNNASTISYNSNLPIPINSTTNGTVSYVR